MKHSVESPRSGSWLLWASHSPSTGELSLYGDIEGLRQLHKCVEAESGTSVSFALRNDATRLVLDEIPLSKLHVAITEEGLIRISLRGNELAIEGSPEPMGYLVNLVDSLVRSGPVAPKGPLRPHVHVNWFPDDLGDYFAPESLSLIIGVE